MNGEILTGWIYMHEKVEPLDKVAKKDQLTVLVQNKHTDRTDNKTFGTDALGRTKYTLHLTEDGLTGDTAQTLGLNKDGSYIYAGYYVTNIEDDFDVDIGTTQDWVEQQWVLNGDIVKKGTKDAQYLDVTFKAKFTGKDSDSITHFKDHDNAYTESGWRLVGQDIADPTDTTTDSARKLLEQAQDIITDSEYIDYGPILIHMGYVDKETNEPLEMNLHIAKKVAQRLNALNVTTTGDVVDTYMAQFPDFSLQDLKTKDWTKITLNDTQQYTYDYLRGNSSGTVPYEGPTGAISELKIFDNLVGDSADDYESFINSYAREFSNSHHVGIVPSVRMIERIATLALRERNMGFLGFKRLSSDELVFDSNAVLYRENGKSFTLENVVMDIEQFRIDYEKEIKAKGYSWGQIADYIIGEVRKKQAGNN
jgi:hypothetical protein